MAEAAGVCPTTNEVCEWRKGCEETLADLQLSDFMYKSRTFRFLKGCIEGWANVMTGGEYGREQGIATEEQRAMAVKRDLVNAERILNLNCVGEVCIVESAITADNDLITPVEKYLQAA